MEKDSKYSLVRNFTELFDEATGESLSSNIREIASRYDGSEFLAAGGMKKIYVTKDRLTNRAVAKAVLKDSENKSKVERFFHEARICASLEHPNIIPVYDLGYDEDEQPFFTMKLIHGQTLKELIASKTASLSELLSVYLKICDAVAYAHSRGIIHRDLKAENIQVSSFGEVLVCDWGLAKKDNEHIDFHSVESVELNPVTLDGVIQGTPGFMSPEQALGNRENVNHLSDIYSLGAILYFILTSQQPLSEIENKDVLEATKAGKLAEGLSSKANVPKALVAVCQKALSVEQSGRYQNAQILKDDVVKYMQGFATSAESVNAFGLFKLLVARNRKVSFTLSLSILVVSTLVLWFLFSLSLSENQAKNSQVLAEEALKKFKEAEDIKHKLAKDAAPRMLERASYALTTYELYEGLEICNLALDLDPDLLPALGHKGYIEMSLLRFKNAQETFRKSGKTSEHKSMKALRDCIAHFGDRTEFKLEDYIWIIEKYSSLDKRKMINEQTFSPIMDHLTLEERREYAKAVISIQNPGIGDIYFSGDSVHLDWSKLKIADGLYKTGISSLDFSNSPLLGDLIFVKGLPLHTLVFPNRPPDKYFKYIKKCRSLKELHVPRAHFKKSDVNELPKRIKVYFY
ncbi:MAG: serine/threonine protein kinase [Lentisphaeraceae bacterium]|nr:serine/threonine protein kinase [Lentisphaeraceae bacterium]